MDLIENKYRDPEAKNKMKEIKKQVYLGEFRRKKRFRGTSQFWETSSTSRLKIIQVFPQCEEHKTIESI